MFFRLWCLYFGVRAWEVRFYEQLGIRHASKVVVGGRYANAFISLLIGRTHRTIQGKRSAQEWLLLTIVAELGHGFFFFLMVAMSVRQAWIGDWRDASVAAVVNLAVNVVPILVQRYNRARIMRMFRLDAPGMLDARLWASVFQLHERPSDPS